MNFNKPSTILPKEALLRFVRIFLLFRNASVSSLKPYISRLEQNFIPQKTAFESTSTKTVLNDSIKFNYKGAINLFLHLSLYWKQYRRLKNIAMQKPTGFVLATSSNRLYKNSTGLFPIDYYKIVLHGFINDDERYLIANRMSDSDYICIVDTDSISPMWKSLSSVKDSNLFIIDKYFTLFYSLLHLKVTLPTAANWIYSKFKKKDSLIYAAQFFNQQYDSILKPFAKVSGLLLTSNSFNIEMLRFNLMKRDSSFSIIELMHGIPSKHVQNYFSNLISFEDANFGTTKLAFTTQIPSIKKSVLARQNERVLKQISINTNFNAYLNTSVKSTDNLVSKFENKISEIYNSISSSTKFSENIIFLFVGGREHDQNFFKSQTFSVEKEIIDIILKFFSEKRIAASVIYSVHPYNKAVPKDIDRLYGGDVVFISDVLLGSIAADACTGLVSSSLFEAGYLGLPTFIPMNIADDLFPKELLELISFDSEDSTKKSLYKFLTEIALTKRINKQERFDRINERVQLL